MSIRAGVLYRRGVYLRPGDSRKPTHVHVCFVRHPGRRLLSFACPKESNQRKRHPRGRGHAGIHARVTARAGSGVRSTAHPCAEIGRARILRAPAAARLFPPPARRGREGTREEQSAAVPAAEAPDICDTRYSDMSVSFALALRVPSEQRRRADGPAACPARGRREGSRRFGQQAMDGLWAEPVRP